MSHAVQVLKQSAPKKGSVRFDAAAKDENPLFSSVYLMRDAARRFLKIKDLDAVDQIEVTVRVITK